MKNQIWSRSKIVWGRYLAVFLLIPFLLFSFGAAAKRSVPAKRSAAQKAKPRLKPVPWLFGASTSKSYIFAINDQIADLRDTEKSLQAQISQTSAAIAQGATDQTSGEQNLTSGEPDLTSGAPTPAPDEIPQAQSDSGKAANKVQGGQKLQPLFTALNSGQTTTGSTGGQTTTGGSGSRTQSALTKQQAALQDTQSLIAQYKEAKNQMQAATLGSEANYKALLEGRLKDSGGFYAQRFTLDQSGGSQLVPSGDCGDYPREWCAAPPNARIYFGGAGFLNRQCVAYAAWKRWKAGKPFATGNAGNWPGNSGRATVGSVAVWNITKSSPYGHVAYVTAVARDSITVSEFNWHPFLHTNRVLKVGGAGFPARFWN